MTESHQQRRARQTAVMSWLRLNRAHQKIGQHLCEHLRTWQISPAQFDVIARLGADEGITQQALAKRLLVTKGNVCQLLDRMEQGGLIVRKQEGRSNRLYLTAAGRDLYAQVVPAQEQAIAARFAGLSTEEQHMLARLLRVLERHPDDEST